MKPGVAAGHPATAEVGSEVLADGGTAVDAVVSMALASCVAETVMSGLLAGCHAIMFDGSRVMNLDGFAAVPSGEGELAELSIPFGDEPVVYSIGAASCAVPGLPAALGELWEAREASAGRNTSIVDLGDRRIPPERAVGGEVVGGDHEAVDGEQRLGKGSAIHAGRTLLGERFEGLRETGLAQGLALTEDAAVTREQGGARRFERVQLAEHLERPGVHLR